MPGFLIQQGAEVLCTHGAHANPVNSNNAVLLGGLPSCTLPVSWQVKGCVGAPGIPPCAAAQWLSGTTRVTSFGLPLLLQSSTSICTPNGLPLLPPILTQLRVSAI